MSASRVIKRIYELLDERKDLNKIYYIDDEAGCNFIQVHKFVPSYAVISYVSNRVEVVKLWRKMLDCGLCPDFSLFIAVRGYKKYALNDLVKWSLAYGGDPNYIYGKGDTDQYLGQCVLSMSKISSIDYYMLMLLKGATPDIFKLFLESDVLCDRNHSSTGLVVGKYAMIRLLEILDLVEVEYTCVVTILVEANI